MAVISAGRARSVSISAGSTTCGFVVFYHQWEPYTNTNGNGTWDAGEPFTDLNGNGVRESSPFWRMTNSLDSTVACWAGGVTPLTAHGTSVTISGTAGVPHGGWFVFSVFNSQRPSPAPGIPVGTKVQNIVPGTQANLLGAQ